MRNKKNYFWENVNWISIGICWVCVFIYIFIRFIFPLFKYIAKYFIE